MQRLISLIDRLSLVTGRAISWLTLGMVVVTFVIVVLRYVFDLGWIWLQESVTWMHALTFMIAAAYTLNKDEHVRVDIFYRQMSPYRQHLVDLIGTIVLLLPVSAFLLLSSLEYVAMSWQIGETSREAGGLPALYLLKTVIPVTASLLALQGIALALKSLLALRSHDEAGTGYDDSQLKF